MKNEMSLALLLPALGVFGIGCGSPSSGDQPPAMFRGGPEHTGVYDTHGVDELGGVLWQFETGGPVRSSPAVAGDLVFVGSTDGKLYALDRTSGSAQWQVDVGSPVSSSPAVARGLVVFGDRNGVFHAVESRSGTPRWQFHTGDLLPWEWGGEGWDVYTSSAVISDTVAVFGGGDGIVYALVLDTGIELWRFDTEGRIRSTPAIANGNVFVGSTDGLAYALDLDSGAERWRFATDGHGMLSEEHGVDRKSIIASPAVGNGTVYVGSRDGYMYALDQQTGVEQWRVSHDGSWAMASPAVMEERIFNGTSDGRFLHAVHSGTGEELWRFVGEGYTWSSPAVAENTVFIGDGAGYLRAIAVDSGLERWSFSVGDGVYSSPVVSDGVVFFGADDGRVYALHGDGRYAHRAVYWEADYADLMYFQSHLETKVYFEQHGYHLLGADDLAEFLEARIEDGEPSVVVFSMGLFPPEVGDEPSDTTLFNRYLFAGGKVVWLDIPPMALQRDEAGRITLFDRDRTTELLGVDHSEFNFDFYASTPTELGRSWGLERGWVSSYSIAVSDSIQVLALDENGRAAAWVKSFGGSPGSGYVAIGMDHTSRNALEAVRAVAEFGLHSHAP